MAEVKRKFYLSDGLESDELKSEWFEVNGLKEGEWKTYFRKRTVKIINIINLLLTTKVLITRVFYQKLYLLKKYYQKRKSIFYIYFCSNIAKIYFIQLFLH